MDWPWPMPVLARSGAGVGSALATVLAGPPSGAVPGSPMAGSMRNSTSAVTAVVPKRGPE